MELRNISKIFTMRSFVMTQEVKGKENEFNLQKKKKLGKRSATKCRKNMHNLTWENFNFVINFIYIYIGTWKPESPQRMLKLPLPSKLLLKRIDKEYSETVQEHLQDIRKGTFHYDKSRCLAIWKTLIG